jgi:chitin deacetylase
MPAAWTASLNAAIAAGAIPDIPPSTLNAAGTTVYAGGLDPNGPAVCSATYGCRIAGDVWDAPDGVYALGFDDGPLPVRHVCSSLKMSANARAQGSSDTLYQFLHNNSQHATHFMIGSNILGNQAQFKYAFETLQDDIAVHTYSHPMMTTLSNAQVVAELGYTIQIIRDLTGGLLPRFWRPPYGDSDARVRAIAQEVFGLLTVIWNRDTADWSITTGATSVAAVDKSLQGWLHGPKSPGLIVLEHEVRAPPSRTLIPQLTNTRSCRRSPCRRSSTTTRPRSHRAGRSSP